MGRLYDELNKTSGKGGRLESTATPPSTNIFGSIGAGVLGGLESASTGTYQNLIDTGLGIGKLVTGGVSKLTGAIGDKSTSDYFNRLTQTQENLGQGMRAQVQPQLESLSGKLGSAGADIALLGGPTEAIAGAKTLAGATARGLAEKLPETLPKVGKAIAYGAEKLGKTLPEIGLGTGYGLVKGENLSDALKTGLGFGIFSGGFDAVGDAYRALKSGLGENISKALGVTGRIPTGELINKTAKSADALKVIADNATGAPVKDINGVEHPFDPSKATYYDTLQAWKIARDKVYNAYDSLAQKAGGEGATFTNKDFGSIINSLKDYTKDSTKAFREKANSLVNDIMENFSVKDFPGKSPDISGNIENPIYKNQITNLRETPTRTDLTPPKETVLSQNTDLRNIKKGTVDLRKLPEKEILPNAERDIRMAGVNLKNTSIPNKYGFINVLPTTDSGVVNLFKKGNKTIDLRDLPKDSSSLFLNAPLKNIQNFLEKVNTDVNMASDKAGAQVSLKLSQELRNILDKKIEMYTGEGYQDIRNQYSALKSIENDLSNQFKKAYRKAGNSGPLLPSYIEGFGGLDVVLGIITKSPGEFVRGVGMNALGRMLSHLKDPEVNLRKAFQEITGASKTQNSLSKRVFGEANLPKK